MFVPTFWTVSSLGINDRSKENKASNLVVPRKASCARVDISVGQDPMYVVLLTPGSGARAVEPLSKLSTTWAKLKSKN